MTGATQTRIASDPLDQALARRLAQLREDRPATLDQLATQSGISRATLSRIERGETSPTASQLGALAAVYGISISRLLASIEVSNSSVVRASQSPVWTDPATGFIRRNVSPPAEGFATELVLGELPPGAFISYERSPQPGLEHHLYVLSGRLVLTVEDHSTELETGDCLRFHLYGSDTFENPGSEPVRYLLAITQP